MVRMYRLKQMCSTSTDAYRRFLKKIFTFKELMAIQRGGRLDGAARYQFLASRWAAKEAVIKAFTLRRIYMRDIEIYTRPSGAPFAVVLDARDATPADVLEAELAKHDNKAGHTGQDPVTQSRRDRGQPEDLESETLINKKPRYPPAQSALVAEPETLEVEGQYVDVSITHDGDYCVAVAMARTNM
ncbi:hypothetical protein CAC42_6320 [Sphaceloma murrayae]|uniref:4'-phosphopantetheinyl transferase domain-containing protein n=1 Tax=Sphaceloma murrayae TaxID=2082308 RepID=A0A2K1QN00_9PEZI|nr:hypothetical protein CAC42_6320 [Sphaceloma murrayae]